MTSNTNIHQPVYDHRININAVSIDSLLNDDYQGKLVTSSRLRDLHVALGAKFCRFYGVEWVASYDDIYREYCAVKTHAGMLDISGMTQLEFRGDNACLALQHYFTNDLIHAQPGQIHYGCLVGQDGRAWDDCMVYKFSDQHLWLVFNLFVPSLPQELLDGWNGTSGVTWREVTQEWVKIQVQGPKSHAIIDSLYPQLAMASVPWFHFAQDKDKQIVAGHCGYSGEKGVEIFVPADEGETLWQNLIETGVLPYGISAIEHCRVEVGLITHNDYLPEFPFPQEIGLAHLVKSSVKDYLLGYVAIQNAPVQHQFWYVEFVTDNPEAWNELPVYGLPALLANGHRGVLTSVAYSPIWRSFVGIAILPVNEAKAGDTVSIGLWQATLLTTQQLREKRQRLQAEYFKS